MEHLTEAMKEEIEGIRDRSGTIGEYRRAVIILLWMRGEPAPEIGRILGTSKANVYKVIKGYRQRGAQSLRPAPSKGRPPKVTVKHVEVLRQAYAGHPRFFGYPADRWTLSLLCRHLEQETGMRLSLEHVRRLIAHLPKKAAHLEN